MDVLTRMANLDEISPEVISQISTLIGQRLTTLGRGSREQRGGIRAVAELFNRLDRTISKTVLESIETDTPELAVSIRNLMFVFDDLIKLDDRGMQELMKEISKEDLPVALRGANTDIKDKFFKNMSSRAAEMLRDDMESKGPVKITDVERAQQNILKVCRKLEEEGRIVVAGAGEEML